MSQPETDDQRQSPPGIATLDTAGITGTWSNTNHETTEIRKIVLTRHGQNLLIRVFGTELQTKNDWGERPVSYHVDPKKPNVIGGFEAHFCHDDVQRHLAANVKLGVLVIQCYNQFQDEDKDNYFTREFFCQQTDDAIPSSGGRVTAGHDEFASMMAGDLPSSSCQELSCKVELSPSHLGIWRNTYQHTRTISHLELSLESGRFSIRAFGVNAPKDWGHVPVEPFAASVTLQAAVGFFADYDFGFKEMRLAANFNKGLLIIAAYNRFQDGSGRSNFFSREFFYRAGGEK